MVCKETFLSNNANGEKIGDNMQQIKMNKRNERKLQTVSHARVIMTLDNVD